MSRGLEPIFVDDRAMLTYDVSSLLVLVIEGKAMREYVSRVGPKGQMTLPAELRRQLGIKPKDRVFLRLDGNGICVRPAVFTLAQVFGSVTPLTHTDDLGAIEREANEEGADREVRGLTRR